MAKRSLKATVEGIALSKRAFERTGWTQDYLAAEVGLSTRQSVWKFFSGRPIERHIFIELCFQLNLDWQAIADLPPPVDAPPPRSAEGQAAAPTLGTESGPAATTDASAPTSASPNDAVNISDLLDRARAPWRDRLEARLGSYQASLDLAQPLALSAAYTPLQISWDLTHQRWLELSDLEKAPGPSPQSSPLASVTSSDPMVTAQADLASRDRTVILGKPGSGKTTLLRHLALACAAGHFRSHHFPIFIELRHWVASPHRSDGEHGIPPLQQVIQETWALVGVSPAETDAILQAGRGLVLLDGLDEVPASQFEAVVRSIQAFATRYYQVPMILTCRTAADRIRFQGFAYGELLDFDWPQVKIFAQRWFTAIAPPRSGDNARGSVDPQRLAADFLERLEQRDNQPIRNLAKTPILLSLVCSVFHARATFPTQRSKLYKAGLDILLGQWDSARGIRRDGRYRQLTTADKLRLLGQIAATQFEAGRSFFEKSEVLAIISDFLTMMDAAAGSSNGPPGDRPQIWENRWADAETILTDIVVQHGLLVECARDIYAFSHLTFQEYLTARKWVAALAACESQEVPMDAAGSPRPLAPIDRLADRLAERLFTPRWRETIGLVVEMLPRADRLLVALKLRADRAIVGNARLQGVLQHIAEKVDSPELKVLTIKPAALRAFYLTLFQNRDLNLAMAIDAEVATHPPAPIALDLALARVLSTAQQLLTHPDLKGVLSLNFALDLDRQFTLSPPFQRAITQLKAQLPAPDQGREALLTWCETDLAQWCEQFKGCLREHRLLVSDWQLAPQDIQILQDYYHANEFVMGCLASGQVSEGIKTALETELLCPATSAQRPLAPAQPNISVAS